MSEDAPTIRVNFSKPMPIFPLDGVVLFPHAVVPLHIFEPRYRQMVSDALDESGQIAMAVFEGDRWREEYHARPPVKACVCVGHIAQHERLSDGRYNILLQGVCRARILEEIPPDEECLYRQGMLAPMGVGEEGTENGARARLRELLLLPPLARFVDPQGHSLAQGLADLLLRDDSDVPTHVVADLVAHLMVKEPRQRYAALAEPEVAERMRLIERELEHLAGMIRRADLQVDPRAPKGVHWN
ncbi:MAG: LON peptidase substrate-binding domain-containing protein [Phycisphaerales bacterium]